MQILSELIKLLADGTKEDEKLVNIKDYAAKKLPSAVTKETEIFSGKNKKRKAKRIFVDETEFF